MFDIVDVLAVREAVARQTGIRRRICRLLMRDYTQSEAARKLGRSRKTISYQVMRIRESFREMGFSEADAPQRPRKEKKDPDIRGIKLNGFIFSLSWRNKNFHTCFR